MFFGLVCSDRSLIFVFYNNWKHSSSDCNYLNRMFLIHKIILKLLSLVFCRFTIIHVFWMLIMALCHYTTYTKKLKQPMEKQPWVNSGPDSKVLFFTKKRFKCLGQVLGFPWFYPFAKKENNNFLAEKTPTLESWN